MEAGTGAGAERSAVYWHRVALLTVACVRPTSMPSGAVMEGGISSPLAPSFQKPPALVKLRKNLTSTTNNFFFSSMLTKQRSLLLICKIKCKRFKVPHHCCILMYNDEKMYSSLLFSKDIAV